MKQIVCLSNSPWQKVPTRTQQLMIRLKEAQVLFFEPPGEGRGHKEPGRRMRPGLTVYTLPPVLAVEERHHYLFRRNQHRLSRFIEQTMDRHRFRDPVLWCTSPEQVHLLDYLSCRGVVYDCDRDWSRLPERWESDLALAADVIFAASPGLCDHLSPCNDNIALLPNGANHPMFCRDDLPVPAELRGVTAPVLGYTGTLWRDLDLSPVLRAALAHPEWAFVFVGRDEGNAFVPTLRELPNVALLGYRSPVELPDYLHRFDVCLHLLRLRDADSDIVPPRFYEYLSTGRPIVSMLFEEQVEPFPDVVYGAHTSEEFVHLCARALSEGDDWASRRRRDYGAAAAWSERAAEVARILETIGLY